MEAIQFENETELTFCHNVSRDETSDAFEIGDESLLLYNYLLSSVYLLLILIGLPSNLLVLVTIVKQRLYSQPTIILLLNLVVTDMLVILLILPLATVTGFSSEFVFGGSDHVRCIVCRTDLVTENILYFSSLLTIMLLAFDRFLFIFRPLKYTRLITARKGLLAIAISWLLSILLSVMPLIAEENIVFSPEVLVCKWERTNIGVISLTFLLFPYFFGLLCNICVIAIATKNIHSVYGVQETQKSTLGRTASNREITEHMRKIRSKKQLHLTRVFGAIICSNTIAWLPFIVLAFMNLSLEAAKPQLELTVAANLLFSAQVVIHPILETAFISDVRKPLKKLVTCHRVRRASNMAHSSGKAMISAQSSKTESPEQETECEERENPHCFSMKSWWCRYLEMLNEAMSPSHFTPPTSSETNEDVHLSAPNEIIKAIPEQQE